MHDQQTRPVSTVTEPPSAEGAALVSLMGNKRIAGNIYYDHQFGMPMARIEVPQTSVEPGFVRYYHLQAIFQVQPCSPEQMIAAAEVLKEPMFPTFLHFAQEEK